MLTVSEVLLYIAICGVFLFLIVIQILHWIGYLYSRFSKNLEQQRQAIKFLTQMAVQGQKAGQKLRVKKDKEFNNRGYA